MDKIIFGITGLTMGGAERVLIDTANALVDKYNDFYHIFKRRTWKRAKIKYSANKLIWFQVFRNVKNKKNPYATKSIND